MMTFLAQAAAPDLGIDGWVGGLWLNLHLKLHNVSLRLLLVWCQNLLQDVISCFMCYFSRVNEIQQASLESEVNLKKKQL